ncbi:MULTISPECIES: hypothetical protein [Rhodococcus]|uniref:hypothetical protein n=1 Tax=Rhodococcus TaxID=1827 RepID=UPI000C7B0AE2|nr:MULTISPECIES: hypothetical protein [Rhodococcus]AUM18239.1 hypothetical protein CSW53_17935 [Rhodococcus ruber]
MTLLDDLNDTTDILGSLNALVTTPPTVRGGPKIGSSGHSAAHLPINAHALDTVRRLEHALRNAVAHVLECAHPVFGHPHNGPREHANWLARVYVKQPAALDDVAEALADEYATARAVIHGPTDQPAEVSPLVRAAADARHGTATELEELTAATGERVKASTIRVWASRGKIRKYTVDGCTVYLLGEVLACAAGKVA